MQLSSEWKKLIELNLEKFASFVENVRTSNFIKNDNTSLAIINTRGNPGNTKSQIPLQQPSTTYTLDSIPSADSAVDSDTGLPASNSLQEQKQIDSNYCQRKFRKLRTILSLSGAIHIIMLGIMYLLLSNIKLSSVGVNTPRLYRQDN